jgi:hypothetical protein
MVSVAEGTIWILIWKYLGGGIAQWYSAGLWAGWLGVRVPARAGNFSLHHSFQTGSGAHPTSYPMAFSLGVKRQEREADHSPPSSAEVKNAWNCTSTTPIRLNVVNAQGKIYLYLMSISFWDTEKLKKYQTQGRVISWHGNEISGVRTFF